jgi:hypothetical protein
MWAHKEKVRAFSLIILFSIVSPLAMTIYVSGFLEEANVTPIEFFVFIVYSLYMWFFAVPLASFVGNFQPMYLIQLTSIIPFFYGIKHINYGKGIAVFVLGSWWYFVFSYIAFINTFY